MASVDDPNALLIYQVGPVRCCAPTNPIEQIVPPPHLTHPPGSDAARPGIFKHGEHIVSVIDLRQRFGIDPQHWQPGRLVITVLKRGYTAFWVDRIVDVIGTPNQGWGHLPPHLPRDTFSRTLLYRDHIHLYTEFEQLPHLHPAGFLREYLAHLEQQTATTDKPQSVSERPLDEPATTSASGAEPAGSRDDTPPESPSPPPSPTGAEPAPEPPRRAIMDSAASRTTSSSPARTPVRAATAAPKPPVASTGTARTGKSPGTTAPPRSGPPPTPPGTHTSAPRPAPSAPPGESAATTQPGTPPASSRETTPDSGAWPALLFLLLLLGGAAGGSYFYFSDEEPSLLTAPPAPASSRPPLIHSPAAPAEESPAPPATDTENQPPVAQAAAPVPKPEPEPEPESKPEPETAPSQSAPEETAVAPPYRASIEHDAEGITLILEEPAPPLPQETVPAPALPPSLAENPLAHLGDDSEGNNQEQPAREADTAPAPTPEPPPAVPHKREIVHIVRRGDTLWDIAKRYVDNPWRYPELAEHSEIRDPDLIYPGDRVRIIIYRGRRP